MKEVRKFIYNFKAKENTIGIKQKYFENKYIL